MSENTALPTRVHTVVNMNTATQNREDAASRYVSPTHMVPRDTAGEGYIRTILESQVIEFDNTPPDARSIRAATYAKVLLEILYPTFSEGWARKTAEQLAQETAEQLMDDLLNTPGLYDPQVRANLVRTTALRMLDSVR